MTSVAKPFYLYHKEDGKIVMDKADHIWHLMQAQADKGKKPPVMVAALYDPIDQKVLEKHAAFHKVSIDASTRPALPEYTETHPPGLATKEAGATPATLSNGRPVNVRVGKS
jgi:hypothetical protein